MVREKYKRDTSGMVDYIYQRMREEYPDNIVGRFIIERINKFLCEYVAKELEEGRPVGFFGLGKFFLRQRISTSTGKMQYYPKFSYSRHFILKIREKLGSASEAELKEIQQRKEFIQEVWDKRIDYMTKNRKRISPAFYKYKDRCETKTYG